MPVLRDKLIAFLCPSADAEIARHDLSDSVYRINSAPGSDVIIAAGDDLRMDPARLPTDMADFEDAIGRGDHEQVIPAAVSSWLFPYSPERVSSLAVCRPAHRHPAAYYPHNYHFLSMAAMMAGRSRDAIEASRNLRDRVPVAVARQVGPLEPLVAYHHLMLATFGRWDEVLSEPLLPADLRLSSGLVYYARGVAHAAKRDWSAAQAAPDTVTRIARGTSPGDRTAMAAGTGENKTIMEVAMHALMGEVAYRRGSHADAARHFRAAANLEDGFNYVEPPQWHSPVRRSLGDALLKAGRAADAERAYREDLARFPENGWALHGLAVSLRAQRKDIAAGEVETRLREAWQGADVTLRASRFEE